MQVIAQVVELMKGIWNENPSFHYYGGFGYCGTASELLRRKIEDINKSAVQKIPTPTLLVGKQLKDNEVTTDIKRFQINYIRNVPASDPEIYRNIQKAFIKRDGLPQRTGHVVVMINDICYDITAGQFGIEQIYPIDKFFKMWTDTYIGTKAVLDPKETFGMRSVKLTQITRANLHSHLKLGSESYDERDIFVTVDKLAAEQLRQDLQGNDEVYREYDSWFGHDGETYDLNRLFEIAHPLATEDVQIDKLLWCLDESLDSARVKRADTSVPIIITQLPTGQTLVVDGAHRVIKAKRQGGTTILAKSIPYSEFEATKLDADSLVSEARDDLSDIKDQRLLWSADVAKGAKIVTAKEMGQNYLLHICGNKRDDFIPWHSRRAEPDENNTIARIYAAPSLVGCVKGFKQSSDVIKYSTIVTKAQATPKDDPFMTNYLGGLYIHSIDFEVALKPSEKLVPTVKDTQETWLVTYNEKTRSYPARIVGRMFFTNLVIEPQVNKPAQETFTFFVEIKEGETINLNDDQVLTAGYWSVVFKDNQFESASNIPLDVFESQRLRRAPGLKF